MKTKKLKKNKIKNKTVYKYSKSPKQHGMGKKTAQKTMQMIREVWEEHKEELRDAYNISDDNGMALEAKYFVDKLYGKYGDNTIITYEGPRDMGEKIADAQYERYKKMKMEGNEDD